MAGAGLADIVGIRPLIIVSSLLLFVSAGFTVFAPGLGLATWRAASARLREAGAAAAGAATTGRPATLADFDRLVGRLTTFGRLTPEQRSAFIREARVLDVPAATRVLAQGDLASDAYFILDGSATAGIPEDDGYRGLSTMAAGDFFGEIAALTGSPRTADVVTDEPTTLLEVPAAALRAMMSVPEIQKFVLSTLTSRLARTESADLPRLAGLAGRPARPAHTAAIGRAGVEVDWPAASRERPGQGRRAAGSGTRNGSHRVDADHDRGARIHRELVTDFAGPQELAEQSTFSEWQTDVDLAAAHGHARDDVVATVDRESASELVHRDVRAALDEAAQLRSRAHIAAVAMSVDHGTLGRGGRVGHGRHREPGGD